MKEIPKMMKFCFHTTFPLLSAQGLPILMILFAASGFFISPVAFAVLFGMIFMGLVLTYGGIEEKNFNKQYGILPIERRNITRGLFCYYFAVGFVGEICGILLSCLSYLLKLGRFLPWSNEQQFIMRDTFYDPASLIMSVDVSVYVMFVSVFFMSLFSMLLCIFGRENRTKIVAGIVSTPLIIAALFIILNENDLIPVIQIRSPDAFLKPQKVIKWIVMNISVLGLTLLFGEIASSKQAAKEL